MEVFPRKAGDRSAQHSPPKSLKVRSMGSMRRGTTIHGRYGPGVARVGSQMRQRVLVDGRNFLGRPTIQGYGFRYVGFGG